jgi:CxxC-x17-CxxC domain-containing protein
MIFNEQYSREDYLKKLEELKINTRTGIEKSYEKAIALWNSLPYREYTGNSRNLNVSGDYLYESKNAKHCYMCSGVEDSKYTQFVSVPKATNCYDYYGWGNSADLIYECATSGEGVSSLKFSFGMFANGLDSEYCGWCIGTKNNFGCVNLKRKQYAILNKIYSKEEYEVLKEKIIKDMKENPYKDSKGRVYPYGEFFPPEFSLFPYNDSNANKFIEKDKEQALREGYNWQDKVENSYQKTIKGNNLPETIDETTNDILNEIIECADCERGYRITEGELSLYRRLDIPVPSKCPKCREARRFSLINKPRFYESECNKCGKKIKTMYDPSQGKIVYCESCYQQEMN